MGMAASQARFLSLTARKNNTEFEGQQINQQRTTLSNKSASYYNQLCNLDVPTPPSSEDFSKTVYTFVDGNETNTINSMIAQAGGSYIVNYTQSFDTENVVSNGNVIVTKTNEDGVDKYLIGSTALRPIQVYSDELLNSDEVLSDPYLGKLVKDGNTEQLKEVLKLENTYMQMLQDKYGDTSEWLVRYQKNASTGGYEPVFYNKEQVENADYSEKTGASITSIKSYVYGQTTETKEIRNAKARLSQDTTGRYTSIYIYDVDASGNPKDTGVEYNLTVTTESDEIAYNDAMNKYNYEKARYDQEIQSINAKIEVVQSQDKDLELKLKQLDTEQSAISTEMEAVKKVISKNVEKTFNTFEA